MKNLNTNYLSPEYNMTVKPIGEQTEVEGKTFRTYDVEIGFRSFKVTVGFSEERLKEHFEGLYEEGNNVVSVIDKIVNNMKAEDIIKLSGYQISMNLENSGETTVKSLKEETVSKLEDIKQSGEQDGEDGGERVDDELANSIDRVVNAFQKSEVKKLLNRKTDPLQNGNHRYSTKPPNRELGVKVEEIFDENIQKDESLRNTEDDVVKIGKEAELPQLFAKESAESKTESEDKFKNIEKYWTDESGGQRYTATEKIDRVDTVERMNDIAKAEKTYLEARLKDEKLGDKEKVEIEKRIELLEKRQEGREISWANSDFFRDMLRKNSDSINSRGEGGIRAAVENYEKLMDEKYYTSPLPVNMRYHSCTTRPPEKITNNDEIELQDFSKEETPTTKGWVRTGVISCLDNGFVNQKSMANLDAELDKALQKEELVEVNSLRKEMAKNIVNVWQKEHKRGNQNIDATAGYALLQLGFSMKEAVKIGDIVHSGAKVKKFDIPPVTEENIDEIKKSVNQTVKKREDLLASQFLQIVMEQVDRTSGEELGDGPLKMVHVGLLNHHSREVDSTGWYHNEEQEMQDMAYIMSQFNGKTMIYDENGPFIDKEGRIHLSQKQLKDKGEIELRSLFYQSIGARAYEK